MPYTIALDAGHGGSNAGASYNGRLEKNDALRLTLAVGGLLENSGVNVVYTRTDDTYDSPARKAQKANESGADFFISIHRNSSMYPNQYSGIESIVYNRYGEAARMAETINENLQTIGYVNHGVVERTNLVVLNRTQMPAILLEIGFINNNNDNAIFDSRSDETAQAIADGILAYHPDNA